MKKLILTTILALFVALGATAQTNDDYKKIWKKGRYTDLGFSVAQTALEGQDVSDAEFGFFFRQGASYLFPGKPLGGLVKVGFDINWVDITVAKYKSNYDASDDIFNGLNHNTGGDGGIIDAINNLGRWGLNIGAIGIGPNVTVAPFSMKSNGARFLKASLYFHYQPTLGAYMVSDHGDLEASYAYCNMFQFGGKITWKAIGVGIEGSWGSGKFKDISTLGGLFGDDEEEANRDEVFGHIPSFSESGKVTRKFANTRIYLSFTF